MNTYNDALPHRGTRYDYTWVLNVNNVYLWPMSYK